MLVPIPRLPSERTRRLKVALALLVSGGDMPKVARTITVPLIPKSDRALKDLAAHYGLSETDIVNRALQLHAAMTATLSAE